MDTRTSFDADMIIKIQKRDDPYARIDNRCLSDARLSYRARGVLAYLLSKPHGWKVRTADVIDKGTEGRDAIRAAFKELQDTGYAKLVNTKAGREWHIFESDEESHGLKTRLCASPEKATDGKPVPLVTKEREVTKETTPTPSKGIQDSIFDQSPRLGAIFGRQKRHAWSEKERKAAAKLIPIDEADLAMVERYYKSERKKEKSFCRRELITLLNNWPGEVDRAREWCRRNRPKNETRFRSDTTPTKEIPIYVEECTPEATKKIVEEFERRNGRLPHGWARDPDGVLVFGALAVSNPNT